MSVLERQLVSATAFCEYLNASNVEGIASLLSDGSFTHEYLPSSLSEGAKGTRGKNDTLDLFKFTFSETVKNMGIGLPPKEVIQSKDKIMFLIVDNGTKPNGSPYTVEYILIIGFEEDGEKITSVREYQDSQYVNDTFKGWYNQSQ